ncbi:unnamed protein product [Rhizophagus irregularis]|nr:unnamed protein product [Rhizophagus irregularis]
MMQDISNLLVFDIDNDNNTNYIDTFFPQSSIRSSYNFSSSDEFRNDHYQHHDVTAQHSFDDIELPDSSEETEEYLELKIGLTFKIGRNSISGLMILLKKKGFNYKTSNVVKINSFVDNHNYILTSNIQEMAPRFQKLTPEMLSDIKKYVIQGRMDSVSIYPLLIHDYPGYTIFKKDLYNAVYQFQLQNNPGDSDASQMLQMLLKKSILIHYGLLNHNWNLYPESYHLLWMLSQQQALYESFHDIVFLDTTSNTNQFQMMLCVVVVIDNHFKSRIVASAIIENETLDTFRWILMTLFEETDINPRIIFTDSDPSLISAIKEIYSNTDHLLCIFHIDLNLRKKLKGKLGACFEEFCHKFYTCQNSLYIELFESRWVQLISQYPESVKYTSTQRIESINKQIHDKVDQSISLCDLVITNINDYVKCKEHFEKF